jgi:hypothetical protein
VLCLLVASWFVLNHFRVLYYDDSIEGPWPQTSPYCTIIQVQDLPLWPIRVAAFCIAGLTLSKVAQCIRGMLANQRMR